MKKILIVGIACIISFNLSGCGKAALEKEPIIIEDSSESSIDVTEPKLEQEDSPSEPENQDQETETDAEPPEYSSDIPSSDAEQSDTETKENDETFKATILLEGMEEEVNYRTYHSESAYRMNYDVDRFTVTSEDGIDTFMAENINPEIYPYVFIRITRSEYLEDGKKINSLTGRLHVYDEDTDQNLSTDYPKDNVKIGDYDAIHFEVIDGKQWNSLVKHIYIINLDDCYYVIETNYFLEASEGYGVRIKAMLDTFVIEE